ncbi:hypothetical protein [Deinococcus yavapaiensis]|nr:hypothetical protein [Deinococcus yavapaiensis]
MTTILCFWMDVTLVGVAEFGAVRGGAACSIALHGSATALVAHLG